MNDSERKLGTLASHATVAHPPTKGFRLLRYFSLASFAAFLLFVAAMQYFDRRQDDLIKQAHQNQNALVTQMQGSLVQRHDTAAPAYLLKVYEAGNVNLARVLANALWENNFVPFLAKAQRIPIDQCRTIAEVKDADGKIVQPGQKQACYAGIGRMIMALPEFLALDAKVFYSMQESTVYKIKVYDLRGITVYSSERNQIGEDKAGNAGWQNAVAGNATSALTHRGKFSAFEGVAENRDLVETYVPLMAPGGARIAAVFEIYSDVTQFLGEIKSTSSEIRNSIAASNTQLVQATAANQDVVRRDVNAQHLIILGLLALLYLVLFLVVRNAQRIIDARDIERSRVIEALRESEELLSESQSIAGLGSYVLDIPTGRWRSSAVLDRIFGIDDNYERSVAGWLSLIHPEWQDQLSRYFADEVLEKHGRFDREYPIIRKIDGDTRWVHGLGELEFDSQGQPRKMIGTINDITVRKATDQALRQSTEYLRAIFDGALDGIAVADAKTRQILTANAAMCDMLGYTPEEIVDIGVSDIHPKQDLPRVIEQFERQLRGEIQMGVNTPMIRKDGSVFYADVKAAPIRLGNKDAMLGIFRDTTERIVAERGLVESEARFRGLVEQSIAGIYIIQDGKFAYVNPRFAEIRGYGSADELIGRDPASLAAEKDRSTIVENNRRLIAGETRSIAFNFTALRKDGSSVDVGVHSSGATYCGRPAVVGLMQDISERKRAEEQIQHYVEQLKTAFLSTVEVVTTLSEMRDPYTAGHERRVGKIAATIGAEFGFDDQRIEGLRVAGYLHDIGKITIPAEILSKPGKLTKIEYQLIQVHPQSSYDVLKDVEFPWPVAQVALQHHERMDGSGYPQGLKGEAILLEARIMAVADVVEAMSSHRPYRPGLGIDKALAEIERGRGTAYDPDVADACLTLFREKGYEIPA